MTEINFSKFDGDRQMTWDASSLDNLHRCPRYYKYSVLDGYRRGMATTTNFGTAYHNSIEEYDRQLLQGSWEFAQRAAVRAAFKNGQGLPTHAERGDKKEGDDNGRTGEALMRAVVWYTEQFKNDPLKTAQLPDGTAGLEVRFEVPISGTEFRLSGRIDKLAYMDDELYIVERKTTAQALGPRYFGNYSPNTQVTTYIWALRNFLGLPIQGVIVEAMQTAVNFSRYGRAIQRRTEAQLEEYEQAMRYHIAEADRFQREGFWPMNESACGNYGGCTFRDVCARPPAQRPDWLAADFVVRPHPSRKPKEPTDDA